MRRRKKGKEDDVVMPMETEEDVVLEWYVERCNVCGKELEDVDVGSRVCSEMCGLMKKKGDEEEAERRKKVKADKAWEKKKADVAMREKIAAGVYRDEKELQERKRRNPGLYSWPTEKELRDAEIMEALRGKGSNKRKWKKPSSDTTRLNSQYSGGQDMRYPELFDVPGKPVPRPVVEESQHVVVDRPSLSPTTTAPDGEVAGGSGSQELLTLPVHPEVLSSWFLRIFAQNQLLALPPPPPPPPAVSVPIPVKVVLPVAPVADTPVTGVSGGGSSVPSTVASVTDGLYWDPLERAALQIGEVGADSEVPPEVRSLGPLLAWDILDSAEVERLGHPVLSATAAEVLRATSTVSARQDALRLLDSVCRHTNTLFVEVRAVVRVGLREKMLRGELRCGKHEGSYKRVVRQNETFLKYYLVAQNRFIDGVKARGDRITVADLWIATRLLARLALVADRRPVAGATGGI